MLVIDSFLLKIFHRLIIQKLISLILLISRDVLTARLFDYFDSGVMEGLQHRLLELATSRTQGRLAETPGNSMALTSQVSYEYNYRAVQPSVTKFVERFTSIKFLFQVLAKRVELDGKTKVLLRWYPQDM